AAACALLLRIAGEGVLLSTAETSALPPLAGILLWTVAITSALHLVLLLGELTITHTTAHAKLAVRELVRGRYAVWFWVGVVLVANSLVAPLVGAWAVIPALIGVFA